MDGITLLPEAWLAAFLAALPPEILALAPALALLAPSSLATAAAPFLAVVLTATTPAACPKDMALVDGDFCPAVDYACLRPTDPANPYRCAEYARRARCRAPVQRRRFCVDRHEWPNKIGENPMVYVDWHHAKELCSSVGKRLCRRTEWMMACEGPKRLPYPWGYERQPSPCNVDRASVDFDVYAMIDPSSREEELARLWQADPIGSHPGCVSAYGAYDMSGNVDEWTDDRLDNPGTNHVSTLNGGYWGPVRDTCRLTTTSHGPTFEFYQVGFRCCAETEDGIDVPPPPVTVLPKLGAPN